MKLKNIITSIALVAISSGLYAQTMVTTDPDTVTLGSTMPYAVTPDPIIAGMAGMDPSDFYWTVTDDADVDLADGAIFNILQGNSGDTLSNDSITIEWGTSTGDYKVKVAEVSNPQFGEGCMGDTEERGIMIVDVPSMVFDGTSGGGCGVTTWSIPLDVSGYGPFEVDFTITYDDGSGPGAPETVTDRVVGAVADAGTGLSLTLDLTAGDLDEGDGTYTVEITDVTDAISRKSLVDVAGDTNTDQYVVGVYPTPDTSPIRHIENVY